MYHNSTLASLASVFNASGKRKMAYPIHSFFIVIGESFFQVKAPHLFYPHLSCEPLSIHSTSAIGTEQQTSSTPFSGS